ncbi:MAG: FtsB family cell division protein [Thermaurantiacus tibetensis]|uniref:FtsB family cell division protein n=1 Tax=Thermaurantiacus tibetensis TaxID=2759035 RepID=UPI00188EB07A|nr:septum formation initiator family protein [Thermaurantiacus tibetensis]
MDGTVIGRLARRALVPVLCLAVGSYFLAHAFTGPSGVLALEGLRAERARLEAEQARLEAERDALAGRIALLDPSGADPDLADELVRRHLGVVRPDELVVPLPPAPADGGAGGVGEPSPGG